MDLKRFAGVAAVAAAVAAHGAFTEETLLLDGWEFRMDGGAWESVSIPHDWAIKGPFDEKIDRQQVKIVQNLEKEATFKTGRTGALPWIGKGEYRRRITVPEGTGRAELVFDGAMAEARVSVDGKEAGYWPYGYNSFIVDISAFGAGVHDVLVKLENVPESSRWYPGAGLYRPVRLRCGPETGFATWGTFARTVELDKSRARIAISSETRNRVKGMKVRHRILDGGGAEVAACEGESAVAVVEKPSLWTCETPVLYTLVSELSAGGKVLDRIETRFGIRTVSVSADGFKLNGERIKFKGVCLHHDLGPLGAAFNKAAFRRRVRLLKEAGANAIRTAHNMPAPWQCDICDEEGMMMMAESFDEWVNPKMKNGYNRFFKDWALRDIGNLVRAHRNHPSIVMWSIGNEVPDQQLPEGWLNARMLQDECHRLDPSRPVTQGIDWVKVAIENGMAQTMDIVGLNYRLPVYALAWTNSPNGVVLGSETASAMASRGVYKFPDETKSWAAYPDGQSSSYDVEHCPWSDLPDDNFAVQDDNPWTIGEFMWTGFDYLGEPTPYDEYWPSRSSYFGMYDLAGLPKDRVWIYRSQWRKDVPTLHAFPHWTWPGREGKVTPVYVYTSFPSAELFVNGRSQGRRTKDPSTRLDRYRLRWRDVVYEPGEIRVVAYDAEGKAAMEETVRTAGAPARIVLEPDRTRLAATPRQADGTAGDAPDMAFVTARVVDAEGNVCPDADCRLTVSVSGAAKFHSVCNGDATSLEMFHLPSMKAFHGALVATVAAGAEEGRAAVEVSSPGLESGVCALEIVSGSAR